MCHLEMRLKLFLFLRQWEVYPHTAFEAVIHEQSATSNTEIGKEV